MPNFLAACCKYLATIDIMPNLVASQKHKSCNGTETKKLVEAVERDTLAKLLKAHTVKTLEAMLREESLDSNGNRKKLILRLRKSLETNQIAKIEKREVVQRHKRMRKDLSSTGIKS